MKSEDAESIAEALSIIKSWLSIDRTVFVIDHSKAEANAIKKIFPGKWKSIVFISHFIVSLWLHIDSSIMICDFHREQAWSRWLTANAADKGRQLRPLLDDLVVASNEQELEIALLSLRSSPLFTEKISAWFSKHWLEYLPVRQSYYCFLGVIALFNSEVGKDVQTATSNMSMDDEWR